MILTVAVYGFGSAFADAAQARDVDLLIIHPTNDVASAEFAIKCKHLLMKHVAFAHVTMLSASEESWFQFVKKSRALVLGTIREGHLDWDLTAALGKISNYSIQL